MPKIIFSNFNSDRRLQQPLYKEFARYEVESRIPIFLEQVVADKSRCDECIYCIFEIEQPTVAAMQSAAEKLGFTCVTGVYNLSALAFRFLVLVPNAFRIESCQNVCLSSDYRFVDNATRPTTDDARRQDKDYMARTGGDLFEKSMMYLVIAAGPSRFNLVVTHLGLGVQARMFQSRQLVNWLQVNCANAYPTVIGGDFNAFDPAADSVYMNQMAVLLDAGYTNLVPFDTSTFKPYDYDIRYLLGKDAGKLAAYDGYLSKAKEGGSDMDQLAADFHRFCTECKPSLSFNRIALDNVFVRGLESPRVLVVDGFCVSDHAAIQLSF